MIQKIKQRLLKEWNDWIFGLISVITIAVVFFVSVILLQKVTPNWWEASIFVILNIPFLFVAMASSSSVR